MKLVYIFALFTMLSCQAQNPNKHLAQTDSLQNTPKQQSKVDKYYLEHENDEGSSLSSGTVSNGSLKNGKLIPFSGSNFNYFDTLSYLNGRAFVNDKLKETILNSYKILESEIPGHQFCIMECSNEEGGEIYPHRTHQNGLSVDFMSPLMKDGIPYYDLDTLGGTHYLLEFDDQGKYSADQSVQIDFEIMAKHIWFIEQEARKNGLKISKIIIKKELKDDLFATVYGKKLKTSSIYFTQNLTPLINVLHDDHYHIDFEIVEK